MNNFIQKHKKHIVIFFILNLFIAIIAYFSYLNKVEYKKDIASIMIEDIVQSNQNFNIFVSEGHYTEGEWIQYVDIDVRTHFKEMVPYILNQLELLFVVESMDIERNSDEYVMYKLVTEDGDIYLNGSNYKPTIIRLIIHIKK